jgi:hypothetical protein
MKKKVNDCILPSQNRIKLIFIIFLGIRIVWGSSIYGGYWIRSGLAAVAMAALIPCPAFIIEVFKNGESQLRRFALQFNPFGVFLHTFKIPSN